MKKIFKLFKPKKSEFVQELIYKGLINFTISRLPNYDLPSATF